MNRLFEYCNDIETGAIASCLHVRNAVKRFRSDLQRTDLIFREDKVKQAISFISKLKHFTGKYSGEPFELQPWQVFIIANLYGFYHPEGKRRFQTAYIEVARKNGKTAISAALGLYHLIADGEDAAQVLLTANSKEQAHICYDMTAAFSKGFDPKRNYLRTMRSEVIFDHTNSLLKVLAAEADKLDGWNCSFGLIDEYHAAPNSKVRDVLRSSMAMRENPLLMTITTAGFDKSLPCYDLRTVCTEIIAGIKADDSTFAIIYTLDEEDNWQDPKNWVKANPNLGVTVNPEFIQKQVLQAKNNPSDEVGIKTKNLNLWCDTATTWIPDDYILKATQKLRFEDFKNESCYIGVDLASNQDLTAVAYMIHKDKKHHFIVKYYLPQESLKTRMDRELYKEWARRGFLTITPGNVTDYNYITIDILNTSKLLNIEAVYYDKYNATQWAIDATDLGLPLEVFSQSIGNFNGPTKEMERAILSGEVVLDDNPITRFCFRNVEIRADFNGNVKPNKGLSAKKVDGVIAAIQGMAAYTVRNANVFTGSIY